MKKIAVLIWLYHNDLSVEFASLLNNTADIFDIYLCLCEDKNNEQSLSNFSDLSNVKSINFYPNIGGDIYSFINEICLINHKDYDYFIKIHSKKSRWGIKNICNWRAMLLRSLIYNKDNIIRNIKFMDKLNLGSIGCGPLIYENAESMHKNKISQFEELMNIVFTTRRFVGGNMFMGRTNLFQRYISPHKEDILKLISAEKGKISEVYSGTYCHAFERILGYIGSVQGLCSAPETSIRILIPNDDIPHKKLNFVILYNRDIYCIQNPSIYGYINIESSKYIEILWKHKIPNILQKYQTISKNTYINTKYIC